MKTRFSLPSPGRPWAARTAPLIAALALWAAPAPLWAQDSRPAPEAPSVEDLQARFDQLEAELAEAMDAFWAAYAAADEAGEEVDMSTYPPEVFYPRYLELADAGLPDALFWVLQAMPQDQRADHFAETLERALTADAKNPAIPGLLMYLNYSIAGSGEPELAVLERYSASEGAEFALTADYARAMILARDESDQAKVAKAVEILRGLAKISREFPAREAASSALFSLEHLGLGMIAPDFETTDVDGNSFKLSDSRGKVTVLEFWGFW